MDTIFALATAQGRAGVSVIRISGPAAKTVAAGLCSSLPGGRQMATRVLRDVGGQPLDHALILVFDGPRSFTGEDVVELHLHGSVAVVSAVLRELGRTDARMAEPGEFTRRALENNKMDLAQVEGLGDLIEAETEAQRQQALRTVSGAVGERIELWRSLLIRAAALVEVTIDFADEDVPVDVTPEVQQLLKQVSDDIEDQLRGFSVAERIRTGFEVAIVGAPNAGKSTLLNALARRDAAITSEIAGTTRDVIEVRMDLNGLPVTLLDTAGLRQATDVIEAQGIARAVSRANDADLRIFLVEPGEELDVVERDGDVVRAPKADTREDGLPSISGTTGQGIDELIGEVTNSLLHRAQLAGLATHERHRMAMQRALSDLASASTMVAAGPDRYDVAAEEIRVAIRSLEAVVGRVDVENLLDEIFSSFCLGK
ncbi:tRNA uridine-5-carboxymethylaminomethyl(34) synthesis GTPase MnmE [Tateyamaria omphalii]|uniref:tRNA uridine-5-carboxymethylaminomethyl(34) synthesis GTPase MnmE n=1 Tax=Tateyamaria omphalii TaxID=299262 RepID=UPI001C992FAE|nr:tRNA uridine-5-carboxymethylaminomethyl(34) synthesis GTPase MnmE [Tateyamaria omphalii]MBY5933400.1 tRNA uridine-5-carboxymethylaminomethyl(34) synthesis GTPase MnmE [Tateyamaria omphalii]